MPDPFQTSLFGDSAGLVAKQEPAPRSAARRKFERLSADIAALKDELQRFQELLLRLQERAHAEMQPLAGQLQEAHSQLATEVDRSLSQYRMGRVQRRLLVDWLLEHCDEVLQAREDETLLDIFNRHSDLPWSELDESRRDFLTQLTEDMARDLFGDDVVDGHDADSPEDLMRFVGERLEERASEPEPPRKPDKRQAAREARRKQEEQEASQSVREVYRKLASAAHPDRESDHERRSERTALMQRINQAYKAQDILALLALQMEVEGLTEAEVVRASEDRLAQFNRLLGEQQTALRDELTEIREHLRQLANDRAGVLRMPAEFERDFDNEKSGLQRALQQTTELLARMREPSQRHAALLAMVEALRASGAAAEPRARRKHGGRR